MKSGGEIKHSHDYLNAACAQPQKQLLTRGPDIFIAHKQPWGETDLPTFQDPNNSMNKSQALIEMCVSI